MPHPFATAWDAFLGALILWVVCIVPTVVCERFRPYQSVQATPAPEAVTKLQGRIDQASLRFTEGLPWSCDQVRLFASTHTREEMLRLARRLTAEQRAEAMKCLRKDRQT